MGTRTIRNLCWHPETATDDKFQNYLKRQDHNLSFFALQGLVRSCHARWSRDFAESSVVKAVRGRLDGTPGPGQDTARRWAMRTTSRAATRRDRMHADQPADHEARRNPTPRS